MKYLKMFEASERLPGRPHTATIQRWIKKGVRVRGQEERVHLKAMRVGALWFTSQEWIDRFINELNAD